MKGDAGSSCPSTIQLKGVDRLKQHNQLQQFNRYHRPQRLNKRKPLPLSKDSRCQP